MTDVVIIRKTGYLTPSLAQGGKILPLVGQHFTVDATTRRKGGVPSSGRYLNLYVGNTVISLALSLSTERGGEGETNPGPRNLCSNKFNLMIYFITLKIVHT